MTYSTRETNTWVMSASNRRFSFHNFMLELVWVHNSKEARNEKTKSTLLWERWKRRNQKSPFGICLQPTKKLGNKLPFRCWEYYPDYLLNGESFCISGSSQNLNEPMIFISPFVEQQENTPRISEVNHPRRFKEITSVCIHSPATEQISDAFEFVSGIKSVTVEKSKNYSLELGFDGQKQG